MKGGDKKCNTQTMPYNVGYAIDSIDTCLYYLWLRSPIGADYTPNYVETVPSAVAYSLVPHDD